MKDYEDMKQKVENYKKQMCIVENNYAKVRSHYQKLEKEYVSICQQFNLNQNCEKL